LIHHRVLSWCHCTLRLLEADPRRAVGARLELPLLVLLPVAHFHRAGKRLETRSAQPVHGTGDQRRAEEQRMIVPLHDDEGVAVRVLARDEPGQLRMSGEAADPEPLALTEGIEREAPVGAQALALGRFDRARPVREKAAEKLAERTLADETDAGAVRLVEHRQSCLARTLAHRAFLELSDRHQRAGELRERYGVEEVALILRRIARLVQLRARGLLEDAGVVSGGEARGAEPARVTQRHAKLDLAIAEHVGVRRAAGAMLRQEVPKDTLAILGRKAHAMQRNRELARDRARVLEILGGSAVAIIVLFPVAHEEAVHLPALLLEQEGRDGGVHAAGETDNDTLAHCSYPLRGPPRRWRAPTRGRAPPPR